MNQVKWFRIALLFLLGLGLVISAPRPTVAQPANPALNDSEQPGSLIVFPKFISGKTRWGYPRSEFELSVLCRFGFKEPVSGAGCLAPYGEGFTVKIRAHWVCPGKEDIKSQFICHESAFALYTPVFGTLSFNPANVGAGPFAGA